MGLRGHPCAAGHSSLTPLSCWTHPLWQLLEPPVLLDTSPCDSSVNPPVLLDTSIPCGSSLAPLSCCCPCAVRQVLFLWHFVCLSLSGSRASLSTVVWLWVMLFPSSSLSPLRTPGEGAASPLVTPPCTSLGCRWSLVGFGLKIEGGHVQVLSVVVGKARGVGRFVCHCHPDGPVLLSQCPEAGRVPCHHRADGMSTSVPTAMLGPGWGLSGAFHISGWVWRCSTMGRAGVSQRKWSRRSRG